MGHGYIFRPLGRAAELPNSWFGQLGRNQQNQPTYPGFLAIKNNTDPDPATSASSVNPIR